MATTGTYAFMPSAGDIVLAAFSMIGVRRAKITQEHLEDAAFWANMVGVDITNRQPNLWKAGSAPFALTAGVSTYDLPLQTVAVLPPIVTVAGIDRPLAPISQADYNAIPYKTQPGPPTSYLFTLARQPTITVWPVPTAAPAMSMSVDIYQQQEDTALAGDASVDVVYRFLEAYTLGLAARLAAGWADGTLSERLAAAGTLNDAYEAKFKLASAQEQERVPLRMQPVLSSYFPR